MWAADALIASLAAIISWRFVLDADGLPGRLHVHWLLLAVMFCLAEIAVVHIQLHRETQTFSLSEIPLVIGLFFATPGDVLRGVLVGGAAALIVYRRQPALKWTYNLGQFSLAVLLASVVFHAIVRNVTVPQVEIFAAFVAALVAIVSGTLAVMLAVTLMEGLPPGGAIARLFAFGSLGAVTNTSFALIAALMLRKDPSAAWLFAFPAATIFLAYRGYTSYRKQHGTLIRLSEATRTVQQSLDVEPAMRTVLEHAREMFHAEVATAMFLPHDPSEAAMEARIGGDAEMETLSVVELDPAEGVWARVIAEGRGVLLQRPIENPRLRSYFAASGIRDAMVVPLWGRDGAIGTIQVANRRGDVETFTPEDLSLFEAFVNQVGIALENVRLMSRLQESVGTLTASSQMKDEFLAMLSHELRSPLTLILGYIKLMRDDGLSPEQRRDGLGVMSAQAEQLRGLIDDLLMDARLTGGPIEPILTRIRIRDVVDRVVTASRTWLQGHEIAVRLDEPLPDILSDADMLERILTNLVSNAAKNSPEGSTVTVAARRDDAGVRFSIVDEGAGIPPELHEHIFERFATFDRTPGKKRTGVGLGLSICQRLAEALEGRVWLVRSMPGEGSEFCLFVPARARIIESLDEVGAPNVVRMDPSRRGTVTQAAAPQNAR